MRISIFWTAALALFTSPCLGQPSLETVRATGLTNPGPASFSIGNAVAPINYWMTAWTLADVMKSAGFEAEIGDTRRSAMWVPVIDGRWAIDRRWDVRTDAAGWPVSLELTDGSRAERLVTIVLASEVTGAFPRGPYRLLYDGTGWITVEGGRVVDRPGAGEMSVVYDDAGPLIVSIAQTDPSGRGDHLRNIRLLRPDAGDERFTRTYLDYLEPYTVIRPLHLLGDQLTYGPRLAWEERKPERYSHWGGALGAPYELAIDLANRSRSDLWLTVPVAADDAYVQELAALVRDRLDSRLRVYVELGNELWNWADPYELGRQHALAEARRRWPGVEGTLQPWSEGDPVNELMMIYSWQGARTVEIGEVFRETFGREAERVVVVLAGQIGGSSPDWHPSRYLLGTPVYVGVEGGPPAGEHVDAFAVAPYIGEEPGVVEFPRSSPDAFFDEAIRYVRGEGDYGPDADEPGLRYMIRHDAALAREFGLPLVAYEGGQHFTGSRFTRDVVNVHPRMYALYRALFDVWQEEGGRLFVHFAGIIPRGRNEPGTEPGYHESENFGIKERQTQSREGAPKWAAVLDVMEAAGQR